MIINSFISCRGPYYSTYELIEQDRTNQTEKVRSIDERGASTVEARWGYFEAIRNLDQFYRRHESPGKILRGYIRDVRAAALDARKYHLRDRSVSLNPYSSRGMRGTWEDGFDGNPPPHVQVGSYNWRAWYHGRVAKQLELKERAPLQSSQNEKTAEK